MQADDICYLPGGDVEGYSTGFRRHLRQLNSIVAASGVPLQGNLCYCHHDPAYLDALPAVARAHKRRNLARALMGKRHLLEVGFNAGHSALLALAFNPELTYHGVDIFENPYSRPCADFLQEVFRDRFVIQAGDSRVVLEEMRSQHDLPDFDIVHIDGGHRADICDSDIRRSIALTRGRDGVHLLLDDTGARHIREVYDAHVRAGNLEPDDRDGTWEREINLLARIVPARVEAASSQ